jgi:hypothetical protein
MHGGRSCLLSVNACCFVFGRTSPFLSSVAGTAPPHARRTAMKLPPPKTCAATKNPAGLLRARKPSLTSFYSRRFCFCEAGALMSAAPARGPALPLLLAGLGSLASGRPAAFVAASALVLLGQAPQASAHNWIQGRSRANNVASTTRYLKLSKLNLVTALCHACPSLSPAALARASSTTESTFRLTPASPFRSVSSPTSARAYQLFLNAGRNGCRPRPPQLPCKTCLSLSLNAHHRFLVGRGSRERF